MGHALYGIYISSAYKATSEEETCHFNVDDWNVGCQTQVIRKSTVLTGLHAHSLGGQGCPPPEQDPSHFG